MPDSTNSKKIEKFFKRIFNSMLKSGRKGQLFTKTTQSLVISDYKKILLLRHDRMGDVLISSPFVKKLLELAPDAQIDIVLSYKNKSAVRAVKKYINGCFVLSNNLLKSAKLLFHLRKNRYDLLIDLLDNQSVNSNLLIKFANPKFSIGFDKSNRYNYDIVVELPDKRTIHPAVRLFDIFCVFGIEADSEDMNLHFDLSDDEIAKARNLLGEKSGEMRLGINLSGSSMSKYWGDGNFISFINLIKTQYKTVEIILFCTGQMKVHADNIISETNVKIAPIQGDFNLYAAMLGQCDVILTPDTAAVHLASALKIPVIAMYQLSENATDMPWFPLNVNYRTIVSEKRISSIDVKVVYDNFQELLKEIN